MLNSTSRDDRVAGRVVVTVLGGAAAVLDYGGLRLLTDPALGGAGCGEGEPRVVRPEREGAAPAAGALAPVDVVLLAHEPDPGTLGAGLRDTLSQARHVLATPRAAGRLGAQAQGLAPWQALDLPAAGGPAVTVIAVPGQDGLDGAGAVAGPATGFVLSAAGQPTVYVSGGGVSLAAVREVRDRIGRIDVALLAAAARVPPPAERSAPDPSVMLPGTGAAAAAGILDAAVVVPLPAGGPADRGESRDRLAGAFAGLGLGDRLAQPRAGAPLTAWPPPGR